MGIPDEAFIRGKVPMTKEEIRILSVAKAHIAPDAVVADIGAGTGSFSVEVSRLAPRGKFYAIERKGEAAALIKKNVEKFALSNIEVIEAEAPEGMEQLPVLDAAIIGGSGSHMTKILDVLTEKVKADGRIVITCIAVQSLMTAINYMRAHEKIYSYHAVQVQVTRLEQVGPYDMAKAMNPIYIVTCVKGEV